MKYIQNEDKEPLLRRIEITTPTSSSVTLLRRLDRLLSNFILRNPQWNCHFFLIIGQVVTNIIISFLPGESVIELSFSCRAAYHSSSKYLQDDLQKLQKIKFQKPLFDSDKMLQCAMEIKKTIIHHKFECLHKRKNLQEKGELFFLSLIIFLIGGICGISIWLLLGEVQRPQSVKKDTVTQGAFGFAGLLILTCFLWICMKKQLNQCTVTKIQQIQFKLAGLDSLIVNLNKWQNKDNPKGDKRMMLDNRSRAVPH